MHTGEMMNRSFREPVDRRTEARTRSGWTSLLWMFVGAVIAVMVGVFLYLSPLFDSYKPKEVDVNPEVPVEPLPQAPKPREYEFYEVLPKRDFQGGQSGLGNAPEPTPQESIKEQPTTPKPAPTKAVDVVVSAKPDEITVVEENETYDAPTKESKTAKAQVSTAPVTYTYILQIRSYDNAEEADKKRSEVIMAGVDAKVVHRIDPSGVALYQVISVPFSDRQDAMEAEQVLSSNGIDALLIEQRR